ncbi:uncharacterized protein V6R79_001857 [Siganus canaliculatus]
MSSTEANSAVTAMNPPPQKKIKRLQKYRPEWEKEYYGESLLTQLMTHLSSRITEIVGQPHLDVDYLQMALQALLSQKVNNLYYRPKPLGIKVLKTVETPKVLSRIFNDSGARPAVTKKNTVAVITDGASMTKMTLFEEYSKRIEEGGSYIMRGFVLKGQNPPPPPPTTTTSSSLMPHSFFADPLSMFQKTWWLRPKIFFVRISELNDQKSFITVEGEVIAETLTATVNLWREAALTEVQRGETVSISLLKTGTAQYDLHSTSFTGLKKQSSFEAVTVLGVLRSEGTTTSDLQLLLEDGKVLSNDSQLWELFDSDLAAACIKGHNPPLPHPHHECHTVYSWIHCPLDPLGIKVLKAVETLKVLSWIFDDSGARPAVTKKNTVAVISDVISHNQGDMDVECMQLIQKERPELDYNNLTAVVEHLTSVIGVRTKEDLAYVENADHLTPIQCCKVIRAFQQKGKERHETFIL